MKKKTRFRFPSAMVTILFFLLLVSLLTYVIPAGEFRSHIDSETGKEIVRLEDFVFIENTPVNLLMLPLYIVKAFTSGSTVTIIVTYMFIGGCVHILTSFGALQAIINTVIRKLKGRRFPILCGFAFVFMLLDLVVTPHAYIAFVPFSIALAHSLGYDAIVGIALPMLGSAVAYCPGALMATTVTAQAMLGLSPYTGLGYRLLCTILLFIPTILYIYVYAEKVRTGKRASIVPYYSYESCSFSDNEQNTVIDLKHVIAILIFVITIAVIVFGSSKYSWSTIEMSACFLTCGTIIGLLYEHDLEKVVALYLKGAQNMLPGAAVVGVASSIAAILSSGGIMYTVVYYSSRAILTTNTVFRPIAIFFTQSVINTVIVSGGGQIAATMPIIGPIADLCGISAQTTVLCTTFGDGFSNYILPHSPVLAGYLGIGKIGFGDWIKFMGKLFLIWNLVACILVSISAYIWV